MRKPFFSRFDLLLVHLIITALLTGVIWILQVLYFPSMKGWQKESFVEFESLGLLHTGFVLMPLMFAEGITGSLLLLFRPASLPAWLPWVGVGFIAGIWLSSLLIQFPTQTMLGLGWDADNHAHLVQGNWFRTSLWTFRLILIAGGLRFVVLHNKEETQV